MQVDDAILAMLRSRGLRDGTTALVAVQLGSVLAVANAGDSRAVLARQGKVRARLRLAAHNAQVVRARSCVHAHACMRVQSGKGTGRGRVLSASCSPSTSDIGGLK